MSSTQTDPKFFNDLIDIPPKGLNELLYRRPENTLINLMGDTVRYANSKIIGLIDRRSSIYVALNVNDTDDDTYSDQSILLGQKGFGEVNKLSFETL